MREKKSFLFQTLCCHCIFHCDELWSVPWKLVLNGFCFPRPNCPCASAGLSQLPSGEAKQLALDLAQRWIRTNWRAYMQHEAMFEKVSVWGVLEGAAATQRCEACDYPPPAWQYDVNGDGKPGGGGEYEVQVRPLAVKTLLSGGKRICLWLNRTCAAAAGLRLDQRRGPAAPAAVRRQPHLGGQPFGLRPPAAAGLHGCCGAPLSPRCQKDPGWGVCFHFSCFTFTASLLSAELLHKNNPTWSENAEWTPIFFVPLLNPEWSGSCN